MTATIKNARCQPQRHPKIEKGIPVPTGRKTSQYAELAKQLKGNIINEEGIHDPEAIRHSETYKHLSVFVSSRP